MTIIEKIGRSVGHTINDWIMRLVLLGLMIAGGYLVINSLFDAYDEPPLIRTLQCSIGIERPDCPDYERALRDAQAAEAAASARAEELRAELDALARLQEISDTFTLFRTFDHEPSGKSVTVSTQYTQLVPPDASPSYSCYIGLDRGPAGEDRNWWFKYQLGAIRDRASERRTAGISDSLWEFAVSVCQPALIGGRDG